LRTEVLIFIIWLKSLTNSKFTMLQDSQTPMECPLCMEEFDLDDKSFFPCTCGYQICRFCWHRIKSESQPEISPTCPACRKPYSDSPANFKPAGDIRKKGKKIKVNKKQLRELRVVQKNLIFVVGLSTRIADSDVLKRLEYFGKFGKIIKVVVNQPKEPTSTGSAYITYARSEDALRALTSVNNAIFDNKTIKANLGTTKYCSHFLRNSACPKTECMYLHSIGEPEASFTKDDMTSGRHVDYEKGLVDGFLKGERERSLNRHRQQELHEESSRELTPTQVTPVQDLDANTAESPSPAPTPSPPPEEQEVEEDEPEPEPEELHQFQRPEEPEVEELSDENQREPLNNIFDDLLGYERSEFGAEFNPFGETQKAFEELIQREVIEGEKLRQGLPPPGFQKVQDPWSSLDPAIIFSAPSPAPTLGAYHMGNGFHQEQQQHHSYGYYHHQQHQQQHPMQAQNGPLDPYPQRYGYLHNQAYPPPGFHLHQLLPNQNTYNYSRENMS